jgi:amino acid transporter, AAT family
MFIIVGVFVDLGFNREHQVIGFTNWTIPGAPFVGGFQGFFKVFVTASFACKFTHRCIELFWLIFLDGGTESLGITAGETRNPSKNMPRVVKFVFWR